MFTIWKYTLIKPVDFYDVPEGARFLAASIQDPFIIVWALVDSTKPTIKRTIAAVNTGQPAPRNDEYIGTVSTEGIVWHIFVTPPVDNSF